MMECLCPPPRLPPGQVFIIVIALLSAGLCPACFPIFPDLAKLPSGVPPLSQLCLYIWSQEGEPDLPQWEGTHSCVPGFLGKSCSLEVLRRQGWDRTDKEGQRFRRSGGPRQEMDLLCRKPGRTPLLAAVLPGVRANRAAAPGSLLSPPHGRASSPGFVLGGPC